MADGERLFVRNEEEVSHTFKTFPTLVHPHHVNMPQRRMEMNIIVHAEPPFLIKSDDFPWMRGWIAVMENPYFVLTDERGTFEFKDFPTGEYTFKAWHEVFGTKTLKITATAGKDSRTDIVFSEKTSHGKSKGNDKKSKD